MWEGPSTMAAWVLTCQTKPERVIQILDHPFLCGLLQPSAGVQRCYGDKNMLRHRPFFLLQSWGLRKTEPWQGPRWRWQWGSGPSIKERWGRSANVLFRCLETPQVGANNVHEVNKTDIDCPLSIRRWICRERIPLQRNPSPIWKFDFFLNVKYINLSLKLTQTCMAKSRDYSS